MIASETSGRRSEGRGAEMTAGRPLDVVTIGEALVRFAPPDGLRLEQAPVWQIAPSGAEGCAAASLARLGLSAGWISKLPEHPLARFVVGELNRHGVDTSRVVWTPTGRIGVCYAERGVPPRPERVWYDREGSTVTTLLETEVDWAYVTSARLALLTGATPALGPRPRALACRAAQEIRAAGRLLALAVDYRPELWAPAEAAEALGALLPLATLAFCSLADAERLFGLRGDPAVVADGLRSRFGIPTAVVTFGDGDAVALADRRYRPERPPRAPGTDPMGGGGAFVAGFLCGYLETGVQRGLDMGGALAALAAASGGGVPIVTRAELEELMTSEDQEIRR